MENIREKVSDFVEETDCGMSRGAIEDLESEMICYTVRI